MGQGRMLLELCHCFPVLTIMALSYYIDCCHHSFIHWQLIHHLITCGMQAADLNYFSTAKHTNCAICLKNGMIHCRTHAAAPTFCLKRYGKFLETGLKCFISLWREVGYSGLYPSSHRDTVDHSVLEANRLTC